MDDVRAVMDAAGSQRAALFGVSEGAPMSLLFAATYPERHRGARAHERLPRDAVGARLPLGPRPRTEYRREVEAQLRIFGSREEASSGRARGLGGSRTTRRRAWVLELLPLERAARARLEALSR